MSPTRIYADFNRLVKSPRDSGRTAVVLDTFGSLRDLCNAGLILSEGMPLIAVDWSDENEDLEWSAGRIEGAAQAKPGARLTSVSTATEEPRHENPPVRMPPRSLFGHSRSSDVVRIYSNPMIE